MKRNLITTAVSSLALLTISAQVKADNYDAVVATGFSNGYNANSNGYNANSNGYNANSNGYNANNNGYNANSNGYNANNNGYNANSNGYNANSNGYNANNNGYNANSNGYNANSNGYNGGNAVDQPYIIDRVRTDGGFTERYFSHRDPANNPIYKWVTVVNFRVTYSNGHSEIHQEETTSWINPNL